MATTTGGRNMPVDDGYFADGKPVFNAIPVPSSAYMDSLTYRSVHFYGSRLCEALVDAARYLVDMEQINGEPPFVLALQHHYSHEDGESKLAFQVTLVIGLLGQL